jgi:hypothetical protein
VKKILLAASVLAGGLMLIGGRAAIDVRADAVSPPVVNQWSPQTLTSGPQPTRITIVGSNLSGVTAVFTSPVVSDRSIAIVSDQAAIITLPANLAPGEYDVTLSSPAGSTLPGSMIVTVLQASTSAQGAGAAGADTNVQPAPAISLQPAPVAVDATPAPATAAKPALPRTAPAATGTGVTTTRASVTTSPFFALAVGIAVGGLLYALWGKEGRLRVARNRGVLAQLWARPMQRLRLGRICLQCGRLHYLFSTRRDLWAAGEFCSATCFVAHQELELEMASAEGKAPSRLRGVGVYTDLEASLKDVLRAEASAHSAQLFDSDVTPNHALAPESDEPVFVVAPVEQARLSA